MGNVPINHKAWLQNAIGFIRIRGLEQEFTDWCGGWRCPEHGAPSVNFCAGYTLPDDVTLGDVLSAFYQCVAGFNMARCAMDGESSALAGEIIGEHRDLLAKFKKED